MRVTVVTPPDPVVTFEEAVARLRLSGDDGERADVEAMIAAATWHIDGPAGWLGRAIGVQTLEMRTEVFGDAMTLPLPPIVEVVSVKHLDAYGVEETVSPSEYELRGSLIGSAFGRRWPNVGYHPEAVRIQYIAGYETTPEPIKAAILLMVGDLYRWRGTTTDAITTQIPMSTAVPSLLSPFRIWY